MEAFCSPASRRATRRGRRARIRMLGRISIRSLRFSSPGSRSSLTILIDAALPSLLHGSWSMCKLRNRDCVLPRPALIRVRPHRIPPLPLALVLLHLLPILPLLHCDRLCTSRRPRLPCSRLSLPPVLAALLTFPILLMVVVVVVVVVCCCLRSLKLWLKFGPSLSPLVASESESSSSSELEDEDSSDDSSKAFGL